MAFAFTRRLCSRTCPPSRAARPAAMAPIRRTGCALGLCVALALAGRAAIAAERTWPQPAGTRSMQVNGYDMTYVERGLPAGAAPTVLLLHGVGGDYRSMLALAERLERSHHVVVPSLRHHFPERWDGRGGDYAFAVHARDVAALIRQLGVGPVHLFGETYGATVAVLVARDAPDLLRSATSYAGMLAAREYMPARGTEEGAKEAERTRLMAAALARGDEEEALRVHRDVIAGEGAWARSAVVPGGVGSSQVASDEVARAFIAFIDATNR